MKDNHYIVKVLEFATTRDKFTLDELLKNVSLTDTQKKSLVYDISEGRLFQGVGNSYYYNVMSQQKTDDVLRPSISDHFRLLEYQELREARVSSLQATKIAMIAIIISIFSTVASIFLSYKTLTTDINIPDKLYGLIKTNVELNEYQKVVLSEFSEKESKQSNQLTLIDEKVSKLEGNVKNLMGKLSNNLDDSTLTKN